MASVVLNGNAKRASRDSERSAHAGIAHQERKEHCMKKLITGAALIAALAIPVAANASSGNGFLTGGAKLNGSFRFVITGPVIDGGTSFVGAEDDQSGLCDGDSGTVMVAGTKYDVVCAHFIAESGNFNTGSPKMRFAFQTDANTWVVVRITNNGSPGGKDTFAWGTTTSLVDAIAWVNRGLKGTHNPSDSWTFLSISHGNYVVHAPN
jgi:hypothetical protein